MTENQQFEITVESDTDQRLDSFLSSQEHLELSRTKVQKLLEQNLITLNGQSVDKKYKPKAGDKFEISVPAPEPSLLEPEDIPLEIVFEDEYLAVINKPAGMVTHPGTGNKSGTLVNALLYHFKSLADSSDLDRPGIVHRLDKDTSGLLLIAKADSVYQKLQEGIQSRDTKRSYLALICGHMVEDKGRIDLPVGRSNRDRKKMAITDDGRQAITDYTLLARYRTYDLLEISLQTGRTHQIRVHFSHLGHPIFGDPEYGGREKWHKGIFGPERPLGKKLLSLLKRQALQAYKLSFTHPISGERLEFEAKLPDDFNKIMNVLDNEGI